MFSTVSTYIPSGLTAAAAPLYWRGRSLNADWRHDAMTGPYERSDPPSAHVAVIVVDALRPDHAPTLTMEFTTCVAPSTWTYPSVTSLHTGLRPSDHGAVAHTAPDDDEFAVPEGTAATPVLPAAFEAAGYDTYAGCAFPVPFTVLDGWYRTHRVYGDASATRVLDDYRTWRDGRESTFAYLHTGDLHAPIDPPDRYVDERGVDLELPGIRSIERYLTDFDPSDPDCRYYREQKLDLYRAALEYVSDTLSRLLTAIGDDTTVVVLGDHGEAYWEHHERDHRFTDSRPNYCVGHGGTPFDVVARTPVGIALPGSESDPPLPRGGWGSGRDLPATLVDLCLEGPSPPGRSWTKRLPTDRVVVCEGVRYGVERKAAYRSDRKLIRSRADDVTLCARLRDGREVFEEWPDEVRRELEAALPDVWEEDRPTASVPSAVETQLDALGYR